MKFEPVGHSKNYLGFAKGTNSTILGRSAFTEYMRSGSLLPYKAENFYLFGSRSMLPSHVCEHSDFDLCTNYSPFLEGKLTLDGWSLISNETYDDPMTVAVYEKSFSGYNYQIVMQHDANSFMDVWGNIDTDFFQKYLWKKSDNYLGKPFVRKYLKSLFDIYALGILNGTPMKKYGFSGKDLSSKSQGLVPFDLSELVPLPVGEAQNF